MSFSEDQGTPGITRRDLYRVVQISQIETGGVFAAEENERIAGRPVDGVDV
jgi:hypothetical protein